MKPNFLSTGVNYKCINVMLCGTFGPVLSVDIIISSLSRIRFILSFIFNCLALLVLLKGTGCGSSDMDQVEELLLQDADYKVEFVSH